ncbi:DUF7410 domain-containing protein [Halolamina sediminis]|uniref:DUF7410 domain-containing protein n=1 Tax=Halolamina sediminis TaxID=1480675 RepID=UPI0006B567DB|nr:hypothetical protein [Halolamina sediminis]
MTDSSTTDEAERASTDAAFAVDDDAERCPYCGRPFPTEHLHALHLGEEHGNALTEAEAERYAAADDRESDELFQFHIKVLALLTLITFVFLYSYTFVWT